MRKARLYKEKTVSIFDKIKAIFLPFLKAFLNKFKTLKFLIPLTLVVLIANSFIVFRINYSEDFKVLYRYERATIALSGDNYLELYRFHDYLQYKDQSVVTTLTANYSTKSNTSKNLILGVNDNAEEVANGDKADIKTEINRIDSKNFEIQREVIFKSESARLQSETAFMELVLGGENITFDSGSSEIQYGKCTIKVSYPSDIFANYQPKDRVIIFSQKTNNNNQVKFNIKFNINCD